ncbi:MAG TPA: hypothetical protein VFJ94_01775 [Intrasporangium sp.]|uniref:hypothetical protein n=1 Tax=Intrasporangium sp. TaxID=1925024 RepID=UPI002D76DAB1|nr:hypothetical protein [Intrasporangium sp.]HET7397223.1 hypothetical protein [Intrasporangium sp.]
MTDNGFALAIGAFVTSSGFAALVALFAAWLAWRGTVKQVETARSAATASARAARALAEASDNRQRWWETARWFWDNRARMPEPEYLAGLEALTDSGLVRTEAQRAMLRAMTTTPRPRG